MLCIKSHIITTFSMKALKIMTLGIIMLSIMTLSIMTFSLSTLFKMTLKITTLRITTLSIMTLSIPTFCILTLSINSQQNDIEHKGLQQHIDTRQTGLNCNTQQNWFFYLSKCCYTDCHSAECH
jgi:hypothetical protein